MANYREDRPGAGASSQEQSNPHYKTHEGLVAGFRAHLKARQDHEINQTPEQSIGFDLFRKYYREPDNSDMRNFFAPLYLAWNILTYDRLPKRSQYVANNRIAEAYGKAHTLRLNPTQVRLLDAAAEAVGIPRTRGQSEIQVPEKHFYWPYGHNGPGAIDPVTGNPGKE